MCMYMFMYGDLQSKTYESSLVGWGVRGSSFHEPSNFNERHALLAHYARTHTVISVIVPSAWNLLPDSQPIKHDSRCYQVLQPSTAPWNL